MKRIVIWLLLIAPLAAGGLALWRTLMAPLPVHAARVVRGPALATVFATGWIEAKERRLLRPPRPAIVERVFAKEGEEVRAGAPLVRLRDSARDVKEERIQAELDRVARDLEPQSSLRSSAEARIAEAHVNEKWASDEVARAKPLREQGLVDERAFDQLVAAQSAAAERVRMLNDDLAHTLADLETQKRQASAELETLRASEKDDELVAPFDGIVLARFAEEGESVNPERDLMKFGDVRELLVEGEVDEEDVARVQVGQHVLVRISGDAAALVQGELAEVFPDSNKATRSFRVRVKFPGAIFAADGAQGLRGRMRAVDGRELIAGASVELGIVVEQKEDALVFPRASLTARGTVFVLKDDAAEERDVDVGIRNFDRCEARGGLREGELVALERLGELKSGRRVVVIEEKSASSEGSSTVRVAAASAAASTKSVASNATALQAVVELGGARVDPRVDDKAKGVVLLFTRSDCPISNRYAPEIHRLIEAWQPKGVVFWLVYVDPKQTDESIRAHLRDYGYTCRAALDPKHELVALCEAKVTPEAALFSPDGRLVYHGRIDDRFPDLGVARVAATTHELEDALTALLAGRAPPVATMPGVGCRIDDLR